MNPTPIHRAVVVLCLLAATPPSQAAPPKPLTRLKALEGASRAEVVQRLLIDRTLKRRLVQDVAMDGATIRFREPSGRAGSVPRESILALLPPSEGPDRAAAARAEAAIAWHEIADLRAESKGRVELTDGQMFPGTLGAEVKGAEATEGDANRATHADTLAWDHPLLGRMSLPFDSIALLLLNSQGATELAGLAPSSGDVIGLVNNDRVEGFVAGIAPGERSSGLVVSVEIGAAHKSASFPADRVSFIRFAATDRPALAPAVRAWLHDGTIVDLASVVSDGTEDGPESLSLRFPVMGAAAGAPGAAARTPVHLAGADVAALNFDPARLRPLAAIAPSAPENAGVFAVRPIIQSLTGAPLGAADIELPGPMTVQWTLPPGTSRLAGTLELPPSCRTWGDCIVTVAVDGAERLKERVNGEHPRVELNIAVAAGANAGEILSRAKNGPGGPVRLTISIDPGESGPVQDHIVLKSMVLLVDSAMTKAK